MLNLKKPYGVVTGHPEIRFEQNGKFYRHDYTEIIATTTPEPPVEQLPPQGADIDKQLADEVAREEQQRRNAVSARMHALKQGKGKVQ